MRKIIRMPLFLVLRVILAASDKEGELTRP